MSDEQQPLTEFEQHIIRILKICDGRASCRDIAERWRGWKHKAGRAAIVGHVKRVGLSMEKRGLLWVLAPSDQFDSGDLRLLEPGWRRNDP